MYRFLGSWVQSVSRKLSVLKSNKFKLESVMMIIIIITDADAPSNKELSNYTI